MKKAHTETLWAMTGLWKSHRGTRRFFYTGTFLTRRDGIRAAERNSDQTWAPRRRNGDRMVKVRITEMLSGGPR